MSRRAAILFIGLGIAWGIPYLFIKVAVGELSPAMLVFARTGLGALILLPIAIRQGAVQPVLRHWRALLLFALVEIAVPWVFLNHAETVLPSSTTGLLISSVPLVAATLALVTRRNNDLSRSSWLGLFAGLAGVSALVGFDIGGSDRLAAASILVVALGYALGPMVLSGPLAGLPGVGIMALSLAAVAIGYLPIVLIAGDVPSSLPSGDVIASVLVLAVISTAAAFLMLFELNRLVGPVRVTAIAYINPAVSVAAGAIVLSEPVTVWTIVGFVLVLGGAYLITNRPDVAGTTEPDLVPAAPEAAVAEECYDTPPVTMDGSAPVDETRIGTSVTRT